MWSYSPHTAVVNSCDIWIVVTLREDEGLVLSTVRDYHLEDYRWGRKTFYRCVKICLFLSVHPAEMICGASTADITCVKSIIIIIELYSICKKYLQTVFNLRCCSFVPCYHTVVTKWFQYKTSFRVSFFFSLHEALQHPPHDGWFKKEQCSSLTFWFETL